MIPLVLTAALALTQGAAEVTVRATLESASGAEVVRVGDPVTWTVEVSAPRTRGGAAPTAGRARPELLDGAILRAGGDIGVGWAILEGPTPVAKSVSDLHLAWTLLPLEGGSVTTPPVTVELGDGTRVVVPEASLDVLATLGPEEDEPRPLPGFRDVADRSVGDPRVALLVVLLIITVPIAVYVLAVRRGARRRSADGDTAPTPEEELAGLDPAGDPSGVMARVGTLTRRAVDGRDGESRAALTDEEWAEAVAAAHAGSPVESAALGVGRAVIASGAVRFGGHTPTAYAAREALEDVRSALARWDAAERTPAEVRR